VRGEHKVQVSDNKLFRNSCGSEKDKVDNLGHGTMNSVIYVGHLWCGNLLDNEKEMGRACMCY
jgi:hypothetical protein